MDSGAGVLIVFDDNRQSPIKTHVDVEEGNDITFFNETGAVKFSISNGGITTCDIPKTSNSNNNFVILVRY